MHLRKKFVMMETELGYNCAKRMMIELEDNYAKCMTIEGGRHEDRCLYKTGTGYESGRN